MLFIASGFSVLVRKISSTPSLERTLPMFSSFHRWFSDGFRVPSGILLWCGVQIPSCPWSQHRLPRCLPAAQGCEGPHCQTLIVLHPWAWLWTAISVHSPAAPALPREGLGRV